MTAPALASTCTALLLTLVTTAAQAQVWGAAQPQPQPGQPQPGQPQPQPNPFGGMQSGGLAPPPPMPVAPPPPGTGQTAQQLDDAKTRDSGRGLEWVWIDVEGGYSHMGLRTFNTHDDKLTAGLVDTTANGGLVGVGAGARLLFFTIGARGRVGFFSRYRVFSVGGEAGMHIPVGKLDPHFDLGAGYTTFQGIKDVNGAASPMGLHGFHLRVQGGADYYLARVVSLGLDVSWELLGLTRPALAPADLAKLTAAQQSSLSTQDTSFGSALGVTGVVGLHF